jgi:hypothetical protein
MISFRMTKSTNLHCKNDKDHVADEELCMLLVLSASLSVFLL